MASVEKRHNLLTHTSIYAVGSIVGAAIGFLTIPILTGFMSVEDYAILELLNQAANVATLIIFVGIRQAFIRMIMDGDDMRAKGRVVGTTLFLIAVSGLSAIVLLLALYPVLLTHLFGDRISFALYLSVLLWLPLEVLYAVGLAHLQSRGESTKYIGFSVTRGILYFALIYLFIARMGGSVEYVFIAQIITCLVGCSYFLYSFFHLYSPRVDGKLLRGLLAFGVPYLPTGAFSYILNNADRWFLVGFFGLIPAGIYALAYKAGFLGTSMLVGPLNKVWAPFAFGVQASPKGPRDIGRVFLIYSFASLGAALAVALAAEVLVKLLAPPEYNDAIALVPMLALAAALNNIASLSDIGLLIAKKTHYKPLVFAIAAGVCILLNVVLTPKLGMTGAALSYLGGMVSLVVTNLWMSNKFYRIEFSYVTALLGTAAILSPYFLKEVCQQAFEFEIVSATVLASAYAALVAALLWRLLRVWQVMKNIVL